MQNKKNLRQRIHRLHLRVNSLVKYGVGIETVGSLKKGSGPLKNSHNNEYDLDVNFTVKTNDSAKSVRNEILSALKKSIRNHEQIMEKSRVIRITVNKNGYTYHYDIAIKNLNNDEIIIFDHKTKEYKWKK